MARIMGNKTLEKELRSKNLGGLHTDAGADEDYGFLAKLEHRPCTAAQFTPPHREISRERLNEATEKQSTSKENCSNRGQVSPGVLFRSSTTVGVMNKKENENTSRNDQHQAFNKHRLSKTADNDSKNSIKMQKRFIEESEENTKIGNKTNSANQMRKNETRPKTVTIITQPPDTTPLPSPRQYSRRTSKAADFFEEDKKIDLVELRLKAARSLDYNDRVKQFCEELEEMASGQPQVDWYSMRLHSTPTHENVKKYLDLPNIVEEMDKREMGNINVRSHTVPQLDLKFESV